MLIRTDKQIGGAATRPPDSTSTYINCERQPARINRISGGRFLAMDETSTQSYGVKNDDGCTIGQIVGTLDDS